MIILHYSKPILGQSGYSKSYHCFGWLKIQQSVQLLTIAVARAVATMYMMYGTEQAINNFTSVLYDKVRMYIHESSMDVVQDEL